MRRRLFTQSGDRLAAETVCRAFADFYTGNRNDFPRDTQDSHYFERLRHAYPIHPEVFDRLYEDWSSLDNFQRTRGVLKLMAKVIHRLWKDGNNDPMIMPGSVPLYDGETRNDIIYYLPPGWDPVMDKDIDSERAETTEIESQDTRFGSLQACRRCARAVFLGSAPSTANQMVRGIELERVLLGAALPGQPIGTYKDAMRRLNDRLHYLNHANNRVWFDTRPNLRREMEERKRKFQDKEDVLPAIRDRVQKSFASGLFAGVHVFTPSGDIPDDWQMRLVVLPPEAYHSRAGRSLAAERALEIIRKRGDQPRFRQNRLIFLAPDYDNVARLRDLTRSMLAWQSIVSDIKDLKLNLDLFQARQAGKSLEEANETLRRMVRESYKWLLAPVQEARPGKGLSDIQWEAFPVNPGALNLTQEIERVLRDNELLITEWAPIHLLKILKDWFWKADVQDVSALNVWQQTCQQLYLPRLLNDHVFHHTVQAGAESRDFFGLAQGREGDRYIGFSLGERTSIYLDTVRLIEPGAAAAYEQSIREPKPPITADQPVTAPGRQPADTHPPSDPRTPTEGSDRPAVKRHFYGHIDLDPILAKKQFADLVDEVVQPFTTQTGVKVRISIEIQADSGHGFDDNLQRTVRENCTVLKFRSAEFEAGE